VPALTPLAAEDPWCKILQGLTVEAELRLLVDGKPAAVARGSLLFTHFGYSGPAALDLSRHWYRAAEARERRVVACFLPDEREDALDQKLVRLGAAEPKTTPRSIVSRWLPERLAFELCREVGIEGTTALSQVPRDVRRALVARVLARPLSVTGTLGYEKAEVTAGGVRLSEVNPSTLESKLVPGLYLCGEILDVEGRLGGFNFQWSWSSGTVTGRASALASQQVP
jgi:predicted Rossmann fold flavoprotein